MTLGFKLPPLARTGGLKFIMPLNAFMTDGAATLAACRELTFRVVHRYRYWRVEDIFVINIVFHINCDAASNGKINNNTDFENVWKEDIVFNLKALF